MEDESRVDFRPLVPEGGLFSCGIAIVGYLDDQGDMAYGIATKGDVPMSMHFGLMEMAKMHLWEENAE